MSEKSQSAGGKQEIKTKIQVSQTPDEASYLSGPRTTSRCERRGVGDSTTIGAPNGSHRGLNVIIGQAVRTKFVNEPRKTGNHKLNRSFWKAQKETMSKSWG